MTLEKFTQQMRIDAEYPDTIREVLPHVVRHRMPFGGFISYSACTADNVDAVIQEQIAFFGDQRGEWKYFDGDSPPDLYERLIAAGFQAEDREALMILDVAQADHLLKMPLTHDLRTITDTEIVLRDVNQILGQVWGNEESDTPQYLLNEMQSAPDSIALTIAYVDNQPACCAWIRWHPNSDFGSLWGGSTVAAYRQRGLYSQVLARRVQAAHQKGMHYLYVDASPMSQPILAKFGFQLYGYSTPMVWNGSA